MAIHRKMTAVALRRMTMRTT
ncbi:hydrophilic acylated surface protein a, partial [Leishmania donovani]